MKRSTLESASYHDNFMNCKVLKGKWNHDTAQDESDDQSIEAAIKTLIAPYDTKAIETTITDRTAVDGDKVYLDYAGTVDGVAFTGGTAKHYALTLGSHSFIGDFEDQDVGH